ncbi:MAG: hypothetical protein M3N52_08750 [Actinomycetota bacterium]|nr:hypothetical protein [Actinomycetota bacterium]
MDGSEHGGLTKLALMIEQDLDTQGWDQPPRLYALCGTVDDPGLRLVCELDSASPSVLEGVAGRPPDVPREAFGLVLAAEDDAYPKDLHDRGWPLGAVDALWGFLPPQWHPRRVRERGITLVTGDGAAYTVRRERGGEPEALPGFDLTTDGSAVDVMRQLLAA